MSKWKCIVSSKHIPCSLSLFILNWVLSQLPSNFPIGREVIPSTPFHPDCLYFPLPKTLCSVTSYPAFHLQNPHQDDLSRILTWSWVGVEMLRNQETPVHARHLGKNSGVVWAPGQRVHPVNREIGKPGLRMLQQSCLHYRTAPLLGCWKRWGKTRKASHNFEGPG